jgi:DNA-binding XRE family transcriptional regulator
MSSKQKITSKINSTKNALATIIFDRRTKLEYTQQQLADICGVDRKTINRIENGHFSPNLDTLVRIFDALSIKSQSVFQAK